MIFEHTLLTALPCSLNHSLPISPGRHDSSIVSSEIKGVTKVQDPACTNACTGDAETGDGNTLNDLAEKLENLSESDRQLLRRLLNEEG